MNTEKTMLKAYREIRESGLLSALRFRVFEVIFKHGPVNIRDITRICRGDNDIDGNYSPRLRELYDRDCIEIFDQVPDTESRHLASRWVLTGRLPIKIPKRETIKQKIARLEKIIAQLQEDNRGLRLALAEAKLPENTLFEM